MSDEKEVIKETLIDDDLLSKEVKEKVKPAEEMLPEDLLAKRIKDEKKRIRKKRSKKYKIFGSVVFFVLIIYLGLMQPEASIEYGICKTFLELNVVYPTTMHVNELDIKNDGSYRLWYTQIDPFGASRLESFQCYFKTDQQGNLQLAKVKMGILTLEKEKVAYFNSAIPYIVANSPDLTFPTPLSDNVASLKFDESAFTNIRNLAQKLPIF
jgi:hypothetical protein